VAAEPSNVLEAVLVDSKNGKVVERWDSAALSSLPKSAFVNDFAYQQIHAGKFGITGPVGAQAMIHLPQTTQNMALLPQSTYILQLESVNGHIWRVDLQGH
jgi:thiosulfate dehydrogenase [quinone] large subunit